MPASKDESFSRKHRLHSSSDFKRVFAKGKRAANRYFVIYSLPNHLLFPRLGIHVKARIGTAVKRNYIKRTVRETFRKLKDHFREPVDLIFIAQEGISELDYPRFEAEFTKAVRNYLK